MNLPTIKSYGNYSSGNYGLNSLVISFDNLDLYYSYDTVIAFRYRTDDILVRQNDWSITTGKHLNWIDNGNKKERISGVEFEKALKLVLSKCNLI